MIKQKTVENKSDGTVIDLLNCIILISMYHPWATYGNISNTSGCICEESTSLRRRDCRRARCHTIFANNQKESLHLRSFLREKNVLFLFFSNWFWQKPDLATCSAGCFRSCNYHFSSSCLFHAFNRHTDGLNHCQTTAQPDWPQSFCMLEKDLNSWKARRTHKQRGKRNESWFIECYLQHFKRGT